MAKNFTIPFTKGQIIEVQITGLGSSGEGVGKAEGFTIFVPTALPGETVKAKLDIIKKNYATGKLQEVVKASPERIKPVCPVYYQCGGCQLGHMSYEGELKEKRQQVVDALTRIGHLPYVKVLPTLKSEVPEHYRNKMQIPVMGTAAKPLIGCFAEGTHKVINIDSCLIQKELNNTIIPVVRAWMTKYKIAPYDEDKGTGIVRHIMGRVGVHTGQVMVCLITATDNVPHIKDLSKALKEAIPGLTSVVQNVNKRQTSVILGNKTQLIYGKETIKDSIGNLHFNISAQSFFQVNSEQVEKLYGTALEYADLKGTELVADVYCGTGTISLFLAQKAKQVIGIEIVPSAIRDAKINAKENKVRNAQFILGDAAKELPNLVADGLRPDVIVLDPPRAGCEERVLAAIAKAAPKKVVYVSCNPATLARDMAYLAEHGYNPIKAQPVDMFSRSHHVETVALLTRVNKK